MNRHVQHSIGVAQISWLYWCCPTFGQIEPLNIVALIFKDFSTSHQVSFRVLHMIQQLLHLPRESYQQNACRHHVGKSGFAGWLKAFAVGCSNFSIQHLGFSKPIDSSIDESWHLGILVSSGSNEHDSWMSTSHCLGGFSVTKPAMAVKRYSPMALSAMARSARISAGGSLEIWG